MFNANQYQLNQAHQQESMRKAEKARFAQAVADKPGMLARVAQFFSTSHPPADPQEVQPQPIRSTAELRKVLQG